MPAKEANLIQELERRIIELTEEHWRKTHTAYFLSRLGIELGPIWERAQTDLGIKLKPFISTRLKDRLRFEVSPTDPLQIGLFPKNAVLDKAVDEYFTSSSPSFGNAAVAVPRFSPAFWALFAKPLAKDHRRFICTFAPPQLVFVDLEQNRVPESGWIEVDRELIVPEGEGDRLGFILRSIESWDMAHPELPSVAFAKPRSAATSPRLQPTADDLASKSLLHLMIESMTPEELRRTTLGLDVVAKLLRSNRNTGSR
jgi:hypothetical protein